jgi:hypothetical protein
MNRVLLLIWVAAGILGLTGCTTTTVRVDRVLHASSQQLKDDSPSGRKALAAIASLRQFQEAQAQVRQQIEDLWANQPPMAATPSNNAPQDVEILKRYFQDPLDDLSKQEAKISAQVAVFRGFFTNDATGLAPRIDWEIAKTIMLLDEQKTWLPSFVQVVSHPGVPAVKRALGPGGALTANASQLEIAMSNLVVQASLAIFETTKEGFGGFRTIGIAEVNASDPEYRLILDSRTASLSQEAISKSSSTIAGDAQVIIVQESPAQFRTYQISNDPTTLMKNISLLVAKATAAAAKYLSGGIAP